MPGLQQDRLAAVTANVWLDKQEEKMFTTRRVSAPVPERY